ncbi:LOW QUALITY PROTEIN: conserved hypothetical protein, partial [Streptomyces pristinaespiralis ATCC 25486]
DPLSARRERPQYRHARANARSVARTSARAGGAAV